MMILKQLAHRDIKQKTVEQFGRFKRSTDGRFYYGDFITRYPEDESQSSNGGDYYEGFRLYIYDDKYILRYFPMMYSDYHHISELTLRTHELEKIVKELHLLLNFGDIVDIRKCLVFLSNYYGSD